jgi:hypothetical protein
LALLSADPLLNLFQAQLRVTTLRLAQLQEKKDSQGQITRKDIATLLQQGNVELARAKAQHLLEQDILGDVLEILEMHVGLVLEHFNDLDQRSVVPSSQSPHCIPTPGRICSLSPSPVVAEAASSIIFATPHVDCRGELQSSLVIAIIHVHRRRL